MYVESVRNKNEKISIKHAHEKIYFVPLQTPSTMET